MINNDQCILPMSPTNLCRECREPLNRDIWNSKLDIFTCQNDHCPLFRQPQGFILDPKNAKLFPKTEVDMKYSTAAEAQKDRRAREARNPRPSGLVCENCGGPVRYLCPSELARRKHIFCGKSCWREDQRKRSLGMYQKR